MAAELAADGAVSCWRRFTPPTVKLPRPSGVCFDASGDLWVTCIGDGGAVVQVAGPRRVAPGAELRRFATSSLHAACPAAKPWDVCCIPARGGGGAEGTKGEGALLAVSLHAGKRGGPGAVALLRVADGVRVRLVTGSLLDGEPNMMALQV
ncbi:hypothetical protein MNEG_1274 [Monoraphidium neglectum]|jgi:hypothetical protein|uniref:SMP-30/Gluconolactonase/LRE-like region domain-containing protein n=1 Tax=Monoraphidium neglectum TaxID=145388 RepID=A0A0D2K938_9CHLO|nr:hypothetical protein MNEG_1274 [Monoraphidium neglectum]KIZ06678.1 hypothetical protein MNEG_1274 [Monoraphidium neglectum]|eukprot:XP_013905697.1 hypothetical protein MNEG_1274 [Monoraphidium neglectum]